MITLAQVSEYLKQTDVLKLELLKVLVLRNTMLETITPYLRYQCAKLGFNLELKFGDYDTILQDCLAPHPLLNEKLDAVWIMAHLPTLSTAISENFTAMSEGDVLSEQGRIETYLRQCLKGIRAVSTAPVVLSLFDLPSSPSFGIADQQLPQSQWRAINDLNNQLVSLAAEFKSIYTLNHAAIVHRLGVERVYDRRLWMQSKVPYSLDGFAAIAEDLGAFVRALKGKTKKCLVLDCDNTLWGGIIGEDGFDGIKLGSTAVGEAYQSFQQAAMSLAHRGVILSLNSKNNEADVWEVFDKHPDMVLKRKNIAAARINWQDKATNLRELANELNIGVDSLVFVDDNEFEIEWVRSQLPEVECIHLPKEQTSEHAYRLQKCSLFDSLILSDEDRQRGHMYAAESQRKQLQSQIGDLDEYLKSLEMEISVSLADEFAIPRVSQQTQKTNQFNLTTRRYGEAEIQAFAQSDAADVIYLRLKDKFGDYGIVGTAIIKYESSNAVIDTLLMSCRVLGRRVEDTFLQMILKRAEKRGSGTIYGEYLPTNKNQQVADFYPRFGFETIEESPGGSRYLRSLPAELETTAQGLATIRCDFLPELN